MSYIDSCGEGTIELSIEPSPVIVPVKVGSTTTGEPGTDALVTNSGTDRAPVLDFVIPRGDKGETGDEGYTPQRGVDYWTAADVEAVTRGANEAVAGAVDRADASADAADAARDAASAAAAAATVAAAAAGEATEAAQAATEEAASAKEAAESATQAANAATQAATTATEAATQATAAATSATSAATQATGEARAATSDATTAAGTANDAAADATNAADAAWNAVDAARAANRNRLSSTLVGPPMQEFDDAFAGPVLGATVEGASGGVETARLVLTGHNLIVTPQVESIVVEDGEWVIARPQAATGTDVWVNDSGYEGQINVSYLVKNVGEATNGGAKLTIRYTDGTVDHVRGNSYAADWVMASKASKIDKVVSVVRTGYNNPTLETHMKEVQVELGGERSAYAEPVPYAAVDIIPEGTTPLGEGDSLAVDMLGNVTVTRTGGAVETLAPVTMPSAPATQGTAYIATSPAATGAWTVTYERDINIAIPEEGSEDTGVAARNADKVEALALARRKASTAGSSDPRPLSLLHFSDIHADTTALSRIVGFMGDCGELLDGAICTGDIVYSNYSEGMDWYDAVDGSSQVMLVVGNHDVAASGDYASSGYTEAEIAARYIDPYAAGWGIERTSGKTYYYKDYDAAQVRLVVLNVMLGSDDRTAQLEWLTDVLNDALTGGYAVVVAEHYPPSNGSSGDGKVPTNFTDIDRAPTNTGMGTAYQDVVQTFIDAGGEFVGYICGHTHTDLVLRSTATAEGGGLAYPSQLFILVGCAKRDAANADLEREDGTRSMDLFNVVTIDKQSHTVRIVRMGADMDRYLRSRKTLCIDYTSGSVVSEG